MSDTPSFRDPKLAINRVYTKKGDAGQTSLVGGQRVSKGDLQIEGYGTVDELNAVVGIALVSLLGGEATQELQTDLLKVQHQLFNLGSILATRPEDVGPQMPRIRTSDIEWLENRIDTYNDTLPQLRSFVLPGATAACANLHLCRTVCRRAERLLVRWADVDHVDPLSIAYLNRLSDAFFVWSRWVVVKAAKEEVLWNPNI